MDNYYFLVKVNTNIELYCINIYKSASHLIYNYPICFSGCSMNSIRVLLSLHNIIKLISTTHALYLGKELYKAELCFFIKQIYIQE